ncbi:hypothetical protein SFRURICE_015020 [Spodoptera frugiperda]|nr:hypothetical protein SFRURICE_015020 [Spodoptera frugiperda]
MHLSKSNGKTTLRRFRIDCIENNECGVLSIPKLIIKCVNVKLCIKQVISHAWCLVTIHNVKGVCLFATCNQTIVEHIFYAQSIH